MWDVSPTLLRYDTVETPEVSLIETGWNELARVAGKAVKDKTTVNKDGKTGPFKKPFDDFYRTDSISRASVTMAQSSKAFTHKNWTAEDADANLPLASFG